MRAWLMDSYEGIGKLRLGEVEDPEPGAGQVLLKMRYAALNPADAFLSQAMYPARPSLPHILGRDGVGDVLAVGAGVQTMREGETRGILRGATGVSAWGTLAEKTVVPATDTVPIPEGWSLEQMAGAPLVFLTAWQALTQWSDPPAPPAVGSVLLVTGASGGVGIASILLGRAMGLTVVGLSRDPKKRAKLKELGADFVFAPDDKSLRDLVNKSIFPKRIDLAVDTVGGSQFNDVVALLGPRGSISVVGRSNGVVPEFNTATLFFKRNRIGGVSVGDYAAAETQEVWKQIVSQLNATHRLPVVDEVFPFEEVIPAFARLAHGPLGKVLVRVSHLSESS
jgi:NADPH2:quinone reductase